MLAIPIPKLARDTMHQDLARGLLAVSDVADQLSRLSDALRGAKPDGVLTSCVRQMSVSLRSILVEKKGRLFTRLFQDGHFPRWPATPEGMLAKVVVDASPPMEIEYEIQQTGSAADSGPLRTGTDSSSTRCMGSRSAQRRGSRSWQARKSGRATKR